MTHELLVDALPYIDTGYDEPGAKQAAFSLIEEECRRYKSNKNYLDFLGPVNFNSFQTELLKNEFTRMEQRQPMDMLSMKRYELPEPAPSKQADVIAWIETLENSFAQLEHQAARIDNLELMSEYGPNVWRMYNKTLKTLFDQAEKQLEEVKKQILNVNLTRKNEQLVVSSKLKGLENNWIGLVSKNYEIECAIVELEKELVELKMKKQATAPAPTSEPAQEQQQSEEMANDQSEN